MTGRRTPLCLVAFLLLLLLTAALAPTASAVPSATMHPTPSSRPAGVASLCGPSPAYACTTAGYAGTSTGWWGAKYGSAHSTRNEFGWHNCTLYAAYRIGQNGVGDPGWANHASGWDTSAYARGTRVDQTQANGAVAQWNRGHVAYVEVATPTYIEVTDDNYRWNVTNRWRINVGSPAWPDNFIHFRDLPTDPDPSGEHLWKMRTSNTPGPAEIVLNYGASTDIAIAGDWDGYGGSTVGIVRREHELLWKLRNSNSRGPAHYVFHYGAPTDTPVVGDWDGYGGSTVGIVRRQHELLWKLRNSNSRGPAHTAFYYGAPTDTPVVGDWDGNGTSTIGIVRRTPAGLLWKLRNSNTPGPAEIVFYYGAPTDTPVVGDWDGNRSSTIGIVR